MKKLSKFIYILIIIIVLVLVIIGLVVYNIFSKKEATTSNNTYNVSFTYSGNLVEEYAQELPGGTYDFSDLKLEFEDHEFVKATYCNDTEIKDLSKVKINSNTRICLEYDNTDLIYVTISYYPDLEDYEDEVIKTKKDEIINLNAYVKAVEGKTFKGFQIMDDPTLYEGEYKVTKNVTLYAHYE